MILSVNCGWSQECDVEWIDLDNTSFSGTTLTKTGGMPMLIRSNGFRLIRTGTSFMRSVRLIKAK